MPYHWQSKTTKNVAGVEDMVLIAKISEDAIADNLKKRFMADNIYTYIGPVLIAVNPYKSIDQYGDRDIDQYQGSAIYENPPHIYALTDNAYRNMLIETENQCVIISGESGAGKTVSAKYIMGYIAKVSGGGTDIQRVKDVILESNPLLEAFGNAKTVRNNNSSRFGKYIEIQFSRAGQPDGGRISNFLLEKSRVVLQNPQERNFHIFYQLLYGASPQQREGLGLTEPSYYNYLNRSKCFKVDGTDDVQEFKDTMHAMEVMTISHDTQWEVLKVIAAILHLGNIDFYEAGNYAAVRDASFLEFPAYLLGIDAASLHEKLTSRLMESRWGGNTETTVMTLTVEQASYTRDSLSKNLYTRLFDYLVQTINQAMRKETDELSIGVLDIYGFEIFENNGFEQFCINFVNEKLQQIFIELTLKAEQEEYVEEGIKWTPIDFFNNKVVCDLVEEKRPPGIMCVLDDICATLHAQGDGADQKLLEKLGNAVGSHKHFSSFSGGFTILHYAGEVTYNTDGFCERNRDVLFPDIIMLIQASTSPFLVSLFPDDPNPVDKQGRQKKAPTAAGRIRSQAQLLVDSLMKCTPHYIRCIKPNETKKSHDWDSARCLHQVRYLGLQENIRVRRAGFAFRREFDKFLRRYAIITPETFPHWKGDLKQGVLHLMKAVSMDSKDYQLGKTKVFIKNPESLFLLEEVRERKFDTYRRWKAQQYYVELKQKATDILVGFKERRKGTINRNFVGDYIGYQQNPALRALVGKRERVEFAYTVNKYDRRYRCQKRDLLLTNEAIYIIGLEKQKSGPQKGQFLEEVKRRVELKDVGAVTVSTKQDDFLVLHVPKDYDTVMEMVFKTEFITLLSEKYEASTKSKLKVQFNDTLTFTVKKEGWGGGKPQTVQVSTGTVFEIKPKGTKLMVTVPPGLPKDSTPGAHNFKGAKVSPSDYTKAAPKASAAAAAPAKAAGPPRGAAPTRGGGTAASGAGRGAGAAPAPVAAQPATAGPPKARAAPPPPVAAPKKPPPAPKPKLPEGRVLYDYEAQDADELNLRVGDMVQIVKKDPSGWWQGRFGGRDGLMPANYIEEVSTA